MANNFYQINNEILKLDPYNEKDIEKIQFNHYLCRKENLQRVKGELDRGLFKLSYTTIIADTGLSRRKAQRFIQWFIDKGIIECIKKSQVKGEESIFAYTSVYYLENEKSDTNNDTDCDTNNDTNLSSNSNALDRMSDTNSDTESDTNSDTSKKEKEKENIKNIYNDLHYKSEDYVFSDMINAYTKNPYFVRALEKYIDMRNELSKKDGKQLTERSFKIVLSDLGRHYGKDDNYKLKRIYKTIANKRKSIIYLQDNPFTPYEEIDFNKFIENISNEIKNRNSTNRRRYTQACDVG